jgi:hypothetical protein
VSQLRDLFEGLGFEASDIQDGLVKVQAYPVVLGRHAGDKVDVAVSGVDFPTTPPAGVHVHCAWPNDRPNTSINSIGEGWRYYSRKLASRKNGGIHHITAYLNRVLGDA